MKTPILSFWVIITQSSSPNFWYHNRIGAKFLVKKSEVYFDKFKVIDELEVISVRYIDQMDCERIDGNWDGSMPKDTSFAYQQPVSWIWPEGEDIPEDATVISVRIPVKVGSGFDAAFPEEKPKLKWWMKVRCWFGWHNWNPDWDEIERRRTFSCEWCELSYKFDPETGATHLSTKK